MNDGETITVSLKKMITFKVEIPETNTADKHCDHILEIALAKDYLRSKISSQGYILRNMESLYNVHERKYTVIAEGWSFIDE